jgi:hypothetical protein
MYHLRLNLHIFSHPCLHLHMFSHLCLHLSHVHVLQRLNYASTNVASIYFFDVEIDILELK